MKLSAALFGIGIACVTMCVAIADTTGADPFLWLEDVKGDRALRWVKSQNESTFSELKADPAYEQTRAAADLILSSRDALPSDQLAGAWVFGFQQDRAHPRGIWKRTSIDAYRGGSPDWETLLDLDALSSSENEKWQWRQAACLPPEFQRCLVSLSREGRSGSVLKEFDVTTRDFVRGGFEVGEAATTAAWVDQDTILVATNWGRGSLTASGNPRFARIWSRGQDLRAAQTVYEGTAGDIGVIPRTVWKSDGKVAIFVVRQMDRANSQLFHVDESAKAMRITVPSTSVFAGMLGDEILFQLGRDWRITGQTYAQGSIVSFPLSKYLTSGEAIPQIRLAFAPDRRSSVNSVSTSAEAVYVALMENVQGRLNELTFDGTQWLWRRVTLPDNGTVEVMSANGVDQDVVLKFSGFLIPDGLYILRKGREPRPVHQLQARFNARGSEVRQYEAVSADGARIPYFIVRRSGSSAGSDTPTLLYAYGGFQISTTPWYWSSAGKLWLEKGGAYAVANIRGGGEFGPSWHAAATRENRQRNFDDLAAVAEDMIARGFTSPRRLGIFGSSQGGLLVAGTFVQHPELFNAVVSQVPLTDMLRYTKLAASKNWTSEYGDPADPQMRQVIAQWSPYHNVRSGVKYPNIFFMSSSSDNRVHPGHARKMAAKLEALGQPVLYYEDTEHVDQARRTEQLALTFTYFRRELMN